MKNLNHEWQKSDLPSPKKIKAFGTFVCGGGSSLGYKLAGIDHLGGVEIDKRMMAIYEENLKPKYSYLEDIREFNKRQDLPEELYNLDILDGSPPCSTFSMAGKREAGWGVRKKFAEGQAKQTLDDLLFVYCDTIIKLQPKVAILENVAGLLAGKAKKYAIEVHNQLHSAGYDVQIFLLNSATMGVPQARQRVFFIARKRSLGWGNLKLKFDCEPIKFNKILEKGAQGVKKLWPSIEVRWPYIEEGDQNLKFADAKYRGLSTYNAFFSTNILYGNEVAPTLTSSGTSLYYHEKRNVSDKEYVRMSTFPIDYNFMGLDVRYVCGMSVPPLMIAGIVEKMKEQWFNQYLNTD